MLGGYDIYKDDFRDAIQSRDCRRLMNTSRCAVRDFQSQAEEFTDPSFAELDKSGFIKSFTDRSEIAMRLERDMTRLRAPTLLFAILLSALILIRLPVAQEKISRRLPGALRHSPPAIDSWSPRKRRFTKHVRRAAGFAPRFRANFGRTRRQHLRLAGGLADAHARGLKRRTWSMSPIPFLP